MTPKTQSVCKCVHCEKSVYFEGNYWLLQSPATGQKYEMCAKNPNGRHEVEPVAEPASTGEPPHVHTQGCYECGHDDCPCHGGYFHEQPMCIPEAARPSEPSAPPVELPGPTGEGSSGHSWVEPAAPQTSAEPQPLPCRTPGAVYHFKLAHSEQSGREILTLHVYMPQEISIAEEQAQSIEEKLHDACEAILSAYWPDTLAAAPQPVSGDAPKVEEIRQLAATMFGVMRRGMLNLSMKTDMPAWRELGRSSQEHWKTMARYALEALPLLRPYFHPASQTQGLIGLNEKQLEVISKWAADSPHDIWGSSEVRDFNLRTFARAILSVATPASTARTDAPHKIPSELALRHWAERIAIAALGPKNNREAYREATGYVLGQLRGFTDEYCAAPGSVPQAVVSSSYVLACECLEPRLSPYKHCGICGARTEIERLIAEQGVKPMVTGHELEIPGLTDEDMEGLPGMAIWRTPRGAAERGETVNYRQIIEMPTSLGRTEINANPNSSGFHESCLRAYHILAKVKWLLDKKTDAEVVRELICLMESTHELAGDAQPGDDKPEGE